MRVEKPHNNKMKKEKQFKQFKEQKISSQQKQFSMMSELSNSFIKKQFSKSFIKQYEQSKKCDEFSPESENENYDDEENFNTFYYFNNEVDQFNLVELINCIAFGGQTNERLYNQMQKHIYEINNGLMRTPSDKNILKYENKTPERRGSSVIYSKRNSTIRRPCISPQQQINQFF